MDKIKAWAKKLKRQIFTLYFAYKDARVSWYAKVFAACVVAYAFSPIDLIPDFIPVLGYLDDIIIVPLGIMLALKLIPKSVKIDCEVKAEEMMQLGKPKNWLIAAFIIVIWSAFIFWLFITFYQLMKS